MILNSWASLTYAFWYLGTLSSHSSLNGGLVSVVSQDPVLWLPFCLTQVISSTIAYQVFADFPIDNASLDLSRTSQILLCDCLLAIFPPKIFVMIINFTFLAIFECTYSSGIVNVFVTCSHRHYPSL